MSFFSSFSLGPRTRKPKTKSPGEKVPAASTNDEKRPRTAFSGSQLARLKVKLRIVPHKLLVINFLRIRLA